MHNLSKINKLHKFFLTNSANIGQIIIKNATWLLIGEVLSKIFKFGLIIYAARILGTSDWGIFSYALSTAGLFFVLSDFGLDIFITREASKNQSYKKAYITSALFLRCTLLLLAALLLIIIVPYVSKVFMPIYLLMTIAGIYIFDSLRGFGISLIRSLNLMEKEAFIKTVTGGSIVLIGILFLIFIPSIQSLALAYLIGSGIGLIITIILVYKHIYFFISSLSFTHMLTVLSIVWPFVIVGASSTIMNSSDILMLGFLVPTSDIGIYSAAQKVSQLLLIIPGFIAVSTFPLFSRLTLENSSRSAKLFEKIISFSFLFSIPLAAGGIILSKQIITFVFSNLYSGAAPVLQIFLLMTIMLFPLVIMNMYVYAQNRQKDFILISVFGAIINIVLNMFMIPIYGIIGAAIATLISTTIMTLYIATKIEAISISKLIVQLKCIGYATSIMMLVVALTVLFSINILLNIVIGVVVYFYALYFLKEPLLYDLLNLVKNSN